jgi:hypothetical protein
MADYVEPENVPVNRWAANTSGYRKWPSNSRRSVFGF